MAFKGIPLNIQRFYFTGQYFSNRDITRVKYYYDDNDNIIHTKELFKFNSVVVDPFDNEIYYYDDGKEHYEIDSKSAIEIEQFDYIKEIDFNIDGIEEIYGDDNINIAESKAFVIGGGDGDDKGDYPFLVRLGDLLYDSKCFVDKNDKLIISYLPALGWIENEYYDVTPYGKKKNQTIYQLKGKETKSISVTDYNYQVYHYFELDRGQIVPATKKTVSSIIRIWNENGTITINYCDSKNKVLYSEEVEMGMSVSKVEDSGDYAGYNVEIIYSADNYQRVIWYEVGSKAEAKEPPSGPTVPDIPTP